MPGSLAAPFPSARATVAKGGTPFSWRISGWNYGHSRLAARDFSPAPQNVTDRRACRIRQHVPPIRRPAMREKRSRTFRNERPDREVEENLAAGRHIVVRAQSEPPLEPEHERQCGGDEQHICEMSAHEWPHGEVRLQQPAVHGVRGARRDAHRIAPVSERRDFQRSAKITAPDANARRSFKKMITHRGYPCSAHRQVIMAVGSIASSQRRIVRSAVSRSKMPRLRKCAASIESAPL